MRRRFAEAELHWVLQLLRAERREAARPTARRPDAGARRPPAREKARPALPSRP